MSEKWTWVPFDIYQRTFGKLWMHPISWDISSRKMIVQENSKKLIPWFLVLTNVMFNILIKVYQIGAEIMSEESTPVISTTIRFIMLILLSFGIVVAYCGFYYRSEMVSGFNQGIQLQLDVHKQSGKRKRVKKYDFLGMAVSLLVIGFILYPLALIPGHIILRRLKIKSQNMTSPNVPTTTTTTDHPYVFFAWFISLFLTLTEVSRQFALIVPSVITLLQMVIDFQETLLKQIKENKSRKHGMMEPLTLFLQTRELHLREVILLRMNGPPENLLTFALMAVGLILNVLVNFGTIRLFGVLHIGLYALCLTLSIVIPLIIGYTFPYAIQCNEISMEILEQWSRNSVNVVNNNSGGYRRKLYKRLLRATQPIRIYGGTDKINLYELKKSSKAEYYRLILQYTVDSLVSVKQSVFKKG